MSVNIVFWNASGVHTYYVYKNRYMWTGAYERVLYKREYIDINEI